MTLSTERGALQTLANSILALTGRREHDVVLSLSDQCVVDLKIAAGGRNWRCVAAEILEALAPVLSKDHKPPPTKDRR